MRLRVSPSPNPNANANPEQVEQFCDPNDENGRTTGRILERMVQTWTDMKAAQFVDYKTRIISMTVRP